MRRLLTGFLLALATPLAAQDGNGLLVRVPFQSQVSGNYQADPWTGADVDLGVATQEKGPRALGNLWDYTHVSDGSGWNGRNYARISIWEYDVGQVPEESVGFSVTGSSFTPSAGWATDTWYYLRFRIRWNAVIVKDDVEGGGGDTANLKWFITNSGAGGDNRPMLHFRSPNGSIGGGALNTTTFPHATHNAIRVSRNIDDPSDGFCTSPHGISLNTWHHVQAAFRFGTSGTGVKLWLDNNAEGSPTQQDLSATSPSWSIVAGGLTGAWEIGGYMSDGIENDVSFDLMDVEIATAFDANWYQTGVSAGTKGKGRMRHRGKEADLLAWMGVVLTMAVVYQQRTKGDLF